MLRLISLTVCLFVFQVTAANAQTCSFNVTNLDFGSIDTLGGTAVDMTGTVDISCGGALLGATVRICLNLNAGSGGATSGTRHMRNAANASLDYTFYQDAARTIPWGSVEQPGLGNPVALNMTLPLLGGTANTSRTIYGRVFANQQGSATGAFSSAFSGAEVRFNWVSSGSSPACSTVTQNPTRPSFNVQANVIPNCLVTAQDLDFGAHGVLNANVDATGGLDVTCSPGEAYTVGLNNGLTGTGPTAREMTLGSEAIVYGLYKNAGRSDPWGNSGTELVGGTGSGAAQNIPVYGRAPAQLTPAPGTYTDTVVVTVTY